MLHRAITHRQILFAVQTHSWNSVKTYRICWRRVNICSSFVLLHHFAPTVLVLLNAALSSILLIAYLSCLIKQCKSVHLLCTPKHTDISLIHRAHMMNPNSHGDASNFHWAQMSATSASTAHKQVALKSFITQFFLACV